MNKFKLADLQDLANYAKETHSLMNRVSNNTRAIGNKYDIIICNNVDFNAIPEMHILSKNDLQSLAKIAKASLSIKTYTDGSKEYSFLFDGVRFLCVVVKEDLK